MLNQNSLQIANEGAASMSGPGRGNLELVRKTSGSQRRRSDHSVVLQDILKLVSREQQVSYAQFHQYRLRSAFQPVVSLNHRRVVGYEALMRGHDEHRNPVSPISLYSQSDLHDTVLLDRLCRTIHVQNYPWKQQPDTWLFLNVSPHVVVNGMRYGIFFKELLKRHQIPPHRVVVEILEGATQNEDELERVVDMYRELGCLVAIDDFGAGHSNFERIWRLRPHIVKLDRSIIVRAEHDERVRHILVSLVNLIHESGSIVLIEGIETIEQAMIALETDADLVQGYYFGRPEFTCSGSGPQDLDALCDQYADTSRRSTHEHQAWLNPYIAALRQAATLYSIGVPDLDPFEVLLHLDKVKRCYILDERGRQCGSNVETLRGAKLGDLRYAPLRQADGANWFRRPYFRRAMQQPLEVQITRPYLSIVDVDECITLSIAVNRGGQFFVLCTDLEVDERNVC